MSTIQKLFFSLILTFSSLALQGQVYELVAERSAQTQNNDASGQHVWYVSSLTLEIDVDKGEILIYDRNQKKDLGAMHYASINTESSPKRHLFTGTSVHGTSSFVLVVHSDQKGEGELLFKVNDKEVVHLVGLIKKIESKVTDKNT